MNTRPPTKNEKKAGNTCFAYSFVLLILYCYFSFYYEPETLAFEAHGLPVLKWFLFVFTIVFAALGMMLYENQTCINNELRGKDDK